MISAGNKLTNSNAFDNMTLEQLMGSQGEAAVRNLTRRVKPSIQRIVLDSKNDNLPINKNV